MSEALHGAVRLAHLGVVRARGADAATFLQGQLTADVAALAVGGTRVAGFCSAKGRLQATFLVRRADAETFWLIGSADLLEATRKRLSMFVLRARCTLDDASGELVPWGLLGGAGDAAGAIALPTVDATARSMLVVAPESDEPAGGDVSLDDWRRLEVRSGVPRIEAATVDRFVPQMVNLELVGGVDFQKGCYPGQEVVARSQYRGTLKRRSFLFRCPAASAAAGQDVFATGVDGEPVGTVVNAAPGEGGAGSWCFAELRLAALDAGELRLGSVDGPALQRAPLPYDVPLPADETKT